MKIKVNDKVLVIAGKDKGKVGTVLNVYKKTDRVKVEQVNMRTKHIKKRYGEAGQKVTYEAPLHISNVMILDPKTDKPTRVHYNKLASGKKERVSVKSDSSLDNIIAKGAAKTKKAPTKKVKA